MPGKDIFLSYASEERQRIVPLVRALERTGWSVFWDVEGIRGGNDWRNVLQEEATSSRSVLVVWSEASVDSPFVRDEAEEGRKRNVLVPVLIDVVQPPLGFRGTQYRDLTGWDGKTTSLAFQDLVKDLAGLLGQPLSGNEKVDLALRLAREARDEAEQTAKEAQRISRERGWTEGRQRTRARFFRMVGPLAAAGALVLVTSSLFLWRSGPSAGPRIVLATPGPAEPAPSAAAPPVVLARTARDWVDQGAARYKRGDFGGALEAYNEAIRLKPDDAAAYYSRGAVREKMADRKAAAADFQKYLDLGGGRTRGDQESVEARIRELRRR